MKRSLWLWLKGHRRILLIVGGALLAIGILVQIFYPSDRLLPFTKIDDISVSGWHKKDAAWELNDRYKKQEIAIYFGKVDQPQYRISPETVGLVTTNNKRVESMGYPWYLRLLPASLLWYGYVQSADTPNYQRDDKRLANYISKNLGSSCDVAPTNAALKAAEARVGVEVAISGGKCEPSEVAKKLAGVTPILTNQSIVRIPIDVIEADISTKDAKRVANDINRRIKDGVVIKAGEETVAADAKTVVSWLAFSNVSELRATVDTEKAKDYFSKQLAPKVAISPGVTRVTTRDFQETARVNGNPGVAIDEWITAASISKLIMGEASEAVVATRVVPAKIEYTRTYSSSDTGLSALITQYAEDNEGIYGIQMIELSGQRRRAEFNQSQQFITASTYKLYVAYSTLKRVDSGQWNWSDQVTGGQNLSTCFDKMVANSDNPCAEALYKKIGYQTVINEARALGLNNTVLASDGQKTTAGDLATFLASLESSTIDLSAPSRARLIDAMKRNVFRNGIPAGTSGVVADKVGFLNGLLHDAAIVYSPKGTYVLVIMSDGSSWGKIAELTKKIEALR